MDGMNTAFPDPDGCQTTRGCPTKNNRPYRVRLCGKRRSSRHARTAEVNEDARSVGRTTNLRFAARREITAQGGTYEPGRGGAGAAIRCAIAR
jgi:hypothetical protein